MFRQVVHVTPLTSWYVYIVRCVDGTLYTGIATDIEARVARHNAGAGARYTRTRRPVELVYVECADSRAGALRREYQIKSLKADAKRKLIARR